jgi:hypothetical protein
VLCGDVSVAFPFGIVQEQATETNCGAIGFQVRYVNHTPYLGYSRYEHWFQILSVFYSNASLVVADSHRLCSIPKNNSSTMVAFRSPSALSIRT